MRRSDKHVPDRSRRRRRGLWVPVLASAAPAAQGRACVALAASWRVPHTLVFIVAPPHRGEKVPANRDECIGARTEPSNTHLLFESRAVKALMSVPRPPATNPGGLHHPAARWCMLHMMTWCRLRARACTVQMSAGRRVSCSSRRGALHSIVVQPAVQREAGVAAMCDEDSFAGAPPWSTAVALQHELALFSSSGGRQQPCKSSCG